MPFGVFDGGGGRGGEDKEERLPQASSFLLPWGFKMFTLGHN